MDESRTQSGYSPTTPFQLPSFSSISGNMNQQITSTRSRRESMHESPMDLIQDMRQQISARDQSIALLRTEKNRAQSRYEALETKSQVMDHEVAVLAEEKAELRKRVNILSDRVDELIRDKEELQTQSQADAAQWRQIMSMSSQLQMQSVEESRRFNTERETWRIEREQLEQRIVTLSREASQQSETADSPSASTELRRTLTVSAMSDDQLRQEVVGLRERCQELEAMLSAVVKEFAGIERAGVMIREVKRRMISSDGRRLDGSSASCGL